VVELWGSLSRQWIDPVFDSIVKGIYLSPITHMMNPRVALINESILRTSICICIPCWLHFYLPVICIPYWLHFSYLISSPIGSTRPNDQVRLLSSIFTCLDPDLRLLLETHHHYNLAWLSCFYIRLDC